MNKVLLIYKTFVIIKTIKTNFKQILLLKVNINKLIVIYLLESI